MRRRRMDSNHYLQRAVASLLFCLSITAVQAANITPQARAQAQQIANSTNWDQPRTANKSVHPLGVQTLSIETQERKGSTETSVLMVYQFHYDLQQARLLTVDAGNSRLLKSQAVNSVHLPLNQAEIEYATSLLQKDNAIVQQLRDEQIRRGKVAFVSLSDLEVKASIYEPLDPNHDCFKQRCALLSLFDGTRTVFSTEPVINLQSEYVKLLDSQ